MTLFCLFGIVFLMCAITAATWNDGWAIVQGIETGEDIPRVERDDEDPADDEAVVDEEVTADVAEEAPVGLLTRTLAAARV